MIFFRLFIICTALSFGSIYSKTLIVTFNYNNPEFIKTQKETFDKFVQDDYEFVVYSDSPTNKGHELIAKECQECGIECVMIPQIIHEPPYYLPLNMPEIYSDRIRPSAVRHSHCVQYFLNTRGFDFKGTVLLVDSDAFLVRPLNITELMKDYDMTSFFKGSANEAGATIMYCCPVLTFLNMESLPDKKSINFGCGWVNNCVGDSGGFTHYYIKDHPELRLGSIYTIYGGNMFCYDRFFPDNNQKNANIDLEQKISFWKSKGFNEKEINFLSKNPDTIQYYILGNDCWFLHYRGGSNYEHLPSAYHVSKKKMICEYLEDIMN